MRLLLTSGSCGRSRRKRKIYIDIFDKIETHKVTDGLRRGMCVCACACASLEEFGERSQLGSSRCRKCFGRECAAGLQRMKVLKSKVGVPVIAAKTLRCESIGVEGN